MANNYSVNKISSNIDTIPLSLVLWHRFNSNVIVTGGIIQDSSELINNGSLPPAPLPPSTYPVLDSNQGNYKTGNNALKFTGTSSQFLNLNTNITFYNIMNNNGISFAMWIKIPNATGHRILDIGNSIVGTNTYTSYFNMQLNGNNLVFNINNNGGTNVGTFSVSSIIDNNWHHLVWNIAQNGKWTFYIDNIYTNTSVTITLPIETNTANTRYLGRSIESPPKYLTGIIDDFRIYNRTLTATEVDLIYNTTNATADLANMTGVLAVSKGGTGKTSLLPSRFLTTDANSNVDDSIIIPLPLNKGGIGVTNLTNGIMLVSGNAISTVASLPVSSGGTGTTTLGSANALVWYDNANTKLSSFTLSANHVICTNSSSALTSLSVLDVSRGGTGAGTTNRGILFANGANAFTSLGSNLPIQNGGTGVNTLPVGILLGNGTNALSSISPLNVGRGGIGTTTIAGFLYGNGANAVTGIGTTNVLPLANGGTGRTDGIDAANIKNQDGLYTSANRKGPSKLYRNDSDTNNWIGVKADNNRWLIYSSDNIDTRVKYADSAGSAATAATATSAGSCTGNAATATGLAPGNQLYINTSSPTIYLQDTDNRSAMIHVNSDIFYILNGIANNSTTWGNAPNGRWPMELNVSDGNMKVSGSISEGGSWLSDKYHPKNGNIPSADSCNGTFTLSSCISRQIIVNWQIASNGVANGARIFTNNWWYQGRAFINIAITSFGFWDGTGDIKGDWCGRIYLSNAGGVIAYYVERQSGSLTVSNSWDGSGGNYITVDSAPTYSIGYKIYG
jgi:hypothetical protein